MRLTKHQNRLPRGCGISILGDTENATGQGPEQAALASDALSRWLDAEVHSNIKYAAILSIWDFHLQIILQLSRVEFPKEEGAKFQNSSCLLSMI